MEIETCNPVKLIEFDKFKQDTLMEMPGLAKDWKSIKTALKTVLD